MDIDTLNQTIRQLMREKNTPGLAIAILKDGEAIYSQGFGCRQLKAQHPMTPDTLLGIGSITKSFTAFALLQLEEQGKLSLNDSVAQHLPVEPFASRPAIQLHHLLSHSSGIPSLDAGMLSFAYTFDDYTRIYPASLREDFLAHLADAADFIIHAPGEAFYYNNDMYTCLGFIIEQLTGQPFADYVSEHILKPLNMHRAVFTREAYEQDPEHNIMTGYLPDTQNGKPGLKESAMPMGEHLHAPGGISVSMNELLHYAQCLLNKGEYQGQRLLSEASVNKLFTGEIATPYGFTEQPRYALGWTVEAPTAERPYTLIHHGGGMGTSNSYLLLVPELNFAFAATENAGTGITPIIAKAALALTQDQDPQQAVEDLRIAKLRQELVGTYKTAYDLYSFTLSLNGAVLQVEVEIDDGTLHFPLTASDLDKLEFSVYSLRSINHNKVRFIRDPESGAVAYVSYDRYLYRRV